MKGLLLVERYVLENVGLNGATINEISDRTKLNSSVVQNVLYHLKSINIINYRKGIYSINLNQKDNWTSIISTEKNKKLEIMDLFSQLVNFYYQSEKKDAELKLEKAYMDEFEYKIFQSHLGQIKEFFRGLKGPKSIKKTEREKQEYVFLYANSSLPKLVNASLG